MNQNSPRQQQFLEGRNSQSAASVFNRPRGSIRSMHVSQERYGDALVLTPVGRVDNSTTDGLKSGLDAYVASCRAGGNRLVLDFSKVDYLSSVGLRVLMLAGKEISEQGGSIVVASLQPVMP